MLSGAGPWLGPRGGGGTRREPFLAERPQPLCTRGPFRGRQLFHRRVGSGLREIQAVTFVMYFISIVVTL